MTLLDQIRIFPVFTIFLFTVSAQKEYVNTVLRKFLLNYNTYLQIRFLHNERSAKFSLCLLAISVVA